MCMCEVFFFFFLNWYGPIEEWETWSKCKWRERNVNEKTADPTGRWLRMVHRARLCNCQCKSLLDVPTATHVYCEHLEHAYKSVCYVYTTWDTRHHECMYRTSGSVKWEGEYIKLKIIIFFKNKNNAQKKNGFFALRHFFFFRNFSKKS